MIGLSALGNNIVILNSRKVIGALLDKRSSIYSDRPPLTLMTKWYELSTALIFIPLLITYPASIGFDWSVAFLPYNDEMNRQRKMMLQCVGPIPHKIYESLIRKSVLELTSQLVETPPERSNLVKL